jgi:plasmid stabilization system protein ParE
MSRFRRSPLAEADIAEIRRYIAQENATAADRFVGQLFDIFHLLGRDRKIDQQRANLRSFSHGNYVVFYQLVGKRAEIVPSYTALAISKACSTVKKPDEP